MSGGPQQTEAAGRRGGRRPGGGDTREAILVAARAAFAEHGYDRATIRAIAAGAAVDPALVIHYFGSKEALFGAAVELPIAPAHILAQARTVDEDHLGATIVRAFLDAWDPPEMRQRLLAMLRSATTNDVAMGMIRDILVREVFGPLTQTLGVPDAQLRTTLVGSQFMGLALLRYVAGLEPLASASADDLAAAIGPTMQRYLTGDLSTMSGSDTPSPGADASR